MWMQSRIPLPSTVSQSEPYISRTQRFPVTTCSMTGKRLLGARGSSPMSPLWCAPTGLKQRRARIDFSGYRQPRPFIMISTICLESPQGLSAPRADYSVHFPPLPQTDADEEKIKWGTLNRSTIWRRCRLPTTFVQKQDNGSSVDQSTDFLAAKWITVSTGDSELSFAKVYSRKALSRMSPTTSCTFWLNSQAEQPKVELIWRRDWRMLGEELDRLSMIRIRRGRCSMKGRSAMTVCEPMQPSPPGSRIVFIIDAMLSLLRLQLIGMQQQSSDALQRRRILSLIPQAKPLLEIQPLGSLPPRFAIPLPFHLLPPFLGSSPAVELTAPPTRRRQNQSLPCSFSATYQHLPPVYDKFRELEEPDDFNHVKLDVFALPQRIQAQSKSEGDAEPGLRFDSAFESGNLSKAFRMGEREYHLLLQNDINTRGYTQWFFFQVQNKSCKGQFLFKIVNFYKRRSLYNQGMRVMSFSKSRAQRGEGWHRAGSNVSYYQNQFARGQSRWSTLQWEFQFVEEEDKVYFAYSLPYTYSDLNRFLDRLQTEHLPKLTLRREVLCYTLARNRVDVLTITAPGKRTGRETIVLSARVHPGETVSSLVMEGVIRELLSDGAARLRSRFVFKVVPMLNPDGVIHGNYRCNLAGKDLNRAWDKIHPRLHPEIHALKALLDDIRKKSKLSAFCDLHGHSKKKNVFVYGCHNEHNPFITRGFPYLLSKLCPSFSYSDCSFQLEPGKRGTARVEIYKSMNLMNTFTLESSFCGPSLNRVHFSAAELMEVGRLFCTAVSMYFPGKRLQSERRKSEQQLTLKRLFKELATKQSAPTPDSPSCSDSSQSEVSIPSLPQKEPTRRYTLSPLGKPAVSRPRKVILTKSICIEEQRRLGQQPREEERAFLLESVDSEGDRQLFPRIAKSVVRGSIIKNNDIFSAVRRRSSRSNYQVYNFDSNQGAKKSTIFPTLNIDQPLKKEYYLHKLYKDY